MSKINLTITDRFKEKLINAVYLAYLYLEIRVQIFFGGSSSGKSYFLAQRAVLDVISGGHNYLIVRKVARTLSKSVFNEVCKAITTMQLSEYFSINKSDLVITCVNGYQILFAGLDDVEKIKSITPALGVITDIWVEEATETEYDDIKQLNKRLRGKSQVKKRLILSFNPVYQTHWIFTEYFQGKWDDNKSAYQDDRLFILKTTYRDNQFLMPDDIEELESEADPYYKAVYSDGKWGVLGKVIFKNWRTEDLTEIAKSFSMFQNGLDFGYASDPAAPVRCHFDRARMTLYLLDAKYCVGLTNDLLAAEVKNMCSREVITCDSSEPKSIAELRQYGITAIAAVKGKDSVNFGIQWLQKLQIVIHHTLREAINEFTVYKWREDKDGNVLPEPVDKDNHIIDAIRYALENEMSYVNRNKLDRPMPKRGAL